MKRGCFQRGFTIVELMMVVGILAVLMTIVTNAASGAIRQARSQKAEALVAMIQQGLETYYAMNEEWPGTFGSKVANGIESNVTNDPDVYELTADEGYDCIRQLVKATVQDHNPMVDITGLYVADVGTVGQAESRCTAKGMDMMDAVHGTKRNPNKLRKASQMAFGYPEAKHGYFRHFKIVYSIPSDSITVSQQ